MRIAILLGVSQYKHPSACALPAATADVATMKALVEATGEFQEVLIPTATDHLTVKRELAAFVDAQKGQTVEQVLFYFSGHGLLQDGVFHYLLSAYDPDQLKTTSLESPELDGLLRSLRPSVVIKIVDACQSGNMYIKSADDIRKSVELSGAAFKNVYFLFSSLPEQSSYANKYESFFTAAVARAACAFRRRRHAVQGRH